MTITEKALTSQFKYCKVKCQYAHYIEIKMNQLVVINYT